MPSTLVRSTPSPARTPSAVVAPPGRDRLVDLLRVLAIGVVVLEHWLFPVLAYDPTTGVLDVGNALTTPGAWLTTWVGQVMPIVFFAGGAANATSWLRRRGPDVGRTWYADRLRRLAWPLLPLAAVWLLLPHLLLGLDVPAQPVQLAAHLAGQLVWFLAAYLIAVLLTPVMLRLHGRYGVRVVAGLAAGAVAVDVLRFSVAEPIGYLNLALVWLAAHQLGVLRATGRLARVRGRRALLTGVAGYATVAALVWLAPYPATMIGLPGAAISNANPPTVVLLALGVGQVGLALWLEPRLLRLADRARVARALTWAAPRTMSIYLWHMPALAVVAGLLVVGLGVTTPQPGSATWWWSVPVWLATLGLTLRAILRGCSRFERPARRDGAPPPTRRLVVAAALVGAGLIGVTILGFGAATWSALAVGALAVGVGLLRPRRVVGLAPRTVGQPAPWAAGRRTARLFA